MRVLTSPTTLCLGLHGLQADGVWLLTTTTTLCLGLHGLQADGVRVRPAARQREVLRLRRERLLLRQEQQQVLR